MKRILALLALTLAPALAQNCLGFRELEVATPAGFCAGVVRSGLNFPRGVLPLANGDVLVVEMGGWGPNRGAVTLLARAKGYAPQRLFTQLDRPNGITLGPDGKVYVGEAGRIFRFSLGKPAKEYVITNLPGNGRHPLTQMVFDANRRLLVNVGSASDNCQQDQDKAACREAQTNGLVRRYTFDWDSGKVSGWGVLASGLRNSMALAVHPSGTVLQGENSRDAISAADPKLDDEEHPKDELNVLEAGANYGWPYCYENARNAPEFPDYPCANTRKPAVLLPAHAAPLGMTYWTGGPQPYRGWLVVGYHGYRKYGHRLVAFPVDAKGVPNGNPADLIKSWVLPGGKLGAPVDVKAGPDGRLYVTDDRNGMLVVFGTR